jgi:hypothetical protein
MKPRQWMQIAAVASAMGLAGTAIANDMDRTPGTNDTDASTLRGSTPMSAPSAASSADNGIGSAVTPGSTDNNGASDLRGNASSSTSSDVNAAPDLNRGGDLDRSADVNANPPGASGGVTTAPDSNGQADRGTTQGSTMTSPKSNVSTDANAPTGGARYGSGSEATSISGSDRLGSTNSDNFNTWASDYASQHNGRITRQDFLTEMGNRWDEADARHQGYLSPDEVQQLLIVTPDENSAPARTGSEVQPGDMGPGNVRGK